MARKPNQLGTSTVIRCQCGFEYQRGCPNCGTADPAPSQLAALKLQPGDVLVVTIRDPNDSFATAFHFQRVLSCLGFDNQFVVLHEGQRLETLDDEQLASIGLQRSGSWRTRPPLL